MFPRARLGRSWSNGRSLLKSPPWRQYSQSSNKELEPKIDANASSKVVFSGIQPTGMPHLGNYLGALQQWVKIQNDSERDVRLIYSLVDLHAITLRQNPEQLRRWRTESLAMLLAVGLDPKRSIIFYQSDVSAHAELMWILSCQASTGYLSRMTQWKDKTANERPGGEKLKLGLYSYPVLQAADVLVHRSTHVPVGQDQAQHLEFARELATGFNSVYGNGVLVPPETLISPAKRIMSLADPTAKMSKSDLNPAARILLTDSEVEIRHKISKAVTDSVGPATYDPESRPGVSNLMDMACYCDPKSDNASRNDILSDLKGLSMQALKSRVSDSVKTVVAPIRERYDELVQDKNLLNAVAQNGAGRAIQSSAPTLTKVKNAIGLA